LVRVNVFHSIFYKRTGGRCFPSEITPSLMELEPPHPQPRKGGALTIVRRADRFVRRELRLESPEATSAAFLGSLTCLYRSAADAMMLSAFSALELPLPSWDRAQAMG